MKRLLFVACAYLLFASCTKKDTDMPKHDYRCLTSISTLLYKMQADFHTDSIRVMNLGSNSSFGSLHRAYVDTVYGVDTTYIQKLTKPRVPPDTVYRYNDTTIAVEALPVPACQRL